MTWLLTLLGLALVLVVLRDIFHTLWHPSGFGQLARAVFRMVWRLGDVLGRRTGYVAVGGPVALLLTAAAWTSLLVVGFALVYLPHMPEGFAFASGLAPHRSSDVIASLYLSLVGLATLGLGDIAPLEPWLRAAVPLQALFGFVLLTAAISWVLQLYPALDRRRAFARRLHSMSQNDTATMISSSDASVAVQLLEEVRRSLSVVEMDLMQYGESYYFRERKRDVSLPAVLPYVPRLVAAGRESSAAEVRHAARLLHSGLDGFLGLLAHEFLGSGGAGEVLEAFAADHGVSRIAR